MVSITMTVNPSTPLRLATNLLESVSPSSDKIAGEPNVIYELFTVINNDII